MNESYLVTMIVAVFNGEQFISTCLDSLLRQTIQREKLEILIVNDGSTDGTEGICKKYMEQYDNIHMISKENGGVSAARNCGIQNAKGKYLMFIDSDDTISPETIQNVTAFFEKHEEEVDLVAYPEIPVINGEPAEKHFRYDTLLFTGIYDLDSLENAFITQTRVNICVKNQKENNVLFDAERRYHEDQIYCTEILLKKLKMGFCAEGMYYYVHQPDSIVRTYFYAYYIFESTMDYWEKIFDEYKGREVPYYLQALYIHDINWKKNVDTLLPYHYDAVRFQQAWGRILRLLNRIDDQIILTHPSIDNFHRHYYLCLKEGKDRFKLLQSGNQLVISNSENQPVYANSKIEVVLCNFKVKKNRIKAIAYLKSPIFNYTTAPDLYLVCNKDMNHKEKIPTRLSSWSHYKTKTKTNSFYLFQLDMDISDLKCFELFVDINGYLYHTYYFFMYQVYFRHSDQRYDYLCGEKLITFYKNMFLISDATEQKRKEVLDIIKGKYRNTYKKVWLIRNYCLLPRKKYDNVWLYYDCSGVRKDNGYYQFIHDFEKNDGVVRYYIYNGDLKDVRDLFTRKQRKNVVRFGTWKHKYLYLKARKVITAYIEENNYLPFSRNWYNQYVDISNEPELIYLQHGVLHAHLPWKYSLDRLCVEKEVISTTFERQNLIDNYCFDEEHLIPAGMPRYDYIEQNQTAINRILFAPSWRKYLVGMDADGWTSMENKFLNSDFYRKTLDFLNSRRLHELLEQYDFYLDFKLHPIFERYKHLYTIESDRVTLAKKNIEATEYSVFMTDFSSFSYDFVYLKRPFIYFLPDDEMFRAGMNDYRELDLPYEQAFGDFVKEADDAVSALERILKNGCKVEAKYAERMEGFFFYQDNNQCDRIYNAISGE